MQSLPSPAAAALEILQDGTPAILRPCPQLLLSLKPRTLFTTYRHNTVSPAARPLSVTHTSIHYSIVLTYKVLFLSLFFSFSLRTFGVNDNVLLRLPSRANLFFGSVAQKFHKTKRLVAVVDEAACSTTDVHFLFGVFESTRRQSSSFG